MGHEAIFALNCIFFLYRLTLDFVDWPMMLSAEGMPSLCLQQVGGFFYLYCFWKKDKLYRAV